MKTPDAIKHALEICAWFRNCDCCGYQCVVPICMHRLAEDALSYIQQLEAQTRNGAKGKNEREQMDENA